jgi:hypothetical protein
MCKQAIVAYFLTILQVFMQILKTLKQNFCCATQMWKSVFWIRTEELTITLPTAVPAV